MADDALSLLFVCTHNSARSVAAEAVARKWGEERGRRVRCYSAGTRGSGEIKEAVRRALERAGYSLEGLRGKSLEALMSSGEVEGQITHVVTMCCEAQGDIKQPGIRDKLLSWCGRVKQINYEVAAPTTQCRQEGLCGDEPAANVHYDRLSPSPMLASTPTNTA
ncbi:phosphotyrosine protein phosphatase I superfamily [Baffinella frigidus]|nr:phosphotyrosine protein phosphatase I superfamily [Cryptophyta sp. CCMP2293]